SAVMLMEYVPGESLHEALEQRVVPAPVAIAILTDVAEALAAAAAVGIVHRDVKPANVFLLPGGRAKLGDFGISRIADAGVFRTRDGQVTGTPAYMAPESVTGERDPDSHADDYAFAVMAYEVLVGQRPFQGEGLAVLGQHGFVTPPSPTEVLEAFPPTAADALLAGLDKDPTRRLPARELAARLRSVPAEAWPPPPAHAGARQSAGATVLGQTLPRTVAPVPLPPARRPVRRRTPLLLVGLGLLVATLVAVAVVNFVDTDSPELSVARATVSVDSIDGNCPSARFVFTANIDTNGAPGTLQLRWLQPDGERTEPTNLAVAEGQSPVTASLQFDITGMQPLSGSAQLEVLAPQQVTAEPVDITYSCP
ncbi:MAG: serine/threonine protein kinase, partial [Actinomycetota bacterium]|nr:serine/threonine protein kinase [Actinomycetota bacterium]